MKVPPANDEKIISIISLEFFKISPIPTPIGVAKEKLNKSLMAPLYSSGFLKFLLKDTPSEIASGDLCTNRPIIRLITPVKFPVKPKAIPSNIA
jgi:hypothetical protein